MAHLVRWRAAEEFGDIHACYRRWRFSSESVLLHGIKTLPARVLMRQFLMLPPFQLRQRPLSSVFSVLFKIADILKRGGHRLRAGYGYVRLGGSCV